MPSTEFLLFLVVIIFVVFLALTYYKDTQSEPVIKYKYVPIHKDTESEQQKPNDQGYGQYYGHDHAGPYGGPGPMAGPGPMGGPGPMPGPGIGPGPMPGPVVDPLRKFDYDAVADEFTPPFRRSYYDDYNYRLHPGLYPTYTRGPPGRFRKIGVLIASGVSANDKYKFLLLMGREKYPGREFEYFATGSEADQKMKFYIETKGKEIHDGDSVVIPELEGYNYTFKEDQDLSPKYDPYFI